MQERWSHTQRQPSSSNDDTPHGSFSFQVVLWSLWSLMVVIVACLSWQSDVLARHPVNIVGLVIHSILAGLIGLNIMTIIEMRIEPWRFMD